jgi:spermidine synthase/Tfp pilus assembly protein PilF
MAAEERTKIEQVGKSLAIPCATVFISSFCIMVVELVAGRMIARFLGSSLYTWTSVIGVVLAGITIGNYLGGRVADKWAAKKALTALFALASAACVATVVLNNLIGQWTWLWQFTWPVRVFLHVTFVFLLPSLALGTISPVVAKSALERGLPTGRTVGDVYAWGAAGSIAGTFVAGYYLIATMGTVAIVWAVAGVMMLMALIYGYSMRGMRAAAIVLVCLIYVGNSSSGWATSIAESTGLCESKDNTVIYQDDTQYCHVAVMKIETPPAKLIFMQDKLIHSAIEIDQPGKLTYSYEQIMAAITHRFGNDRPQPNFLILGGGGYVLPRYLERLWPKSKVDVIEIDPGVTNAAKKAFGLAPTERMRSFPLDARNYVDGLMDDLDRGKDVPKYDFIYEDALNDYSVPFQLTTRQFNDKLLRILKDDGIYMIELIDVYDSGLFAGSFINTLKESFPNVYVISENDVPTSARNTFVVVASRQKLDLADLKRDYTNVGALWYLTDTEIEALRAKSGGLVLTDDFAPVEHLLAPVVTASTAEAIALRKAHLARGIAKEAEELSRQGRLDDTLKKLDELVSMDPSVSFRAYHIMALIFRDSGLIEDALKIYQAGMEKNSLSAVSKESAIFCYNYALLLESSGAKDRAKPIYNLAEGAYSELVKKEPAYIEGFVQLGNIRAQLGDFPRAVEYFGKAVELDPTNLENNMNLLQAQEATGQLDDVIQSAQKVVNMYFSRKDTASAAKIQDYMRYLEAKKATPHAK